METGQIDPWLLHQCGQSGNEVQRLENHMRRAILVRDLELVKNITSASERRFSETAELLM